MKKFTIFIIVVTIFFGTLYLYENHRNQPALNITQESKLIIMKEDILNQFNDENQFKLDEENTLYLSSELLKEKLDVNFDYDLKNKVATITTFDKVIKFYGEKDLVKVNNKEANYIKTMILLDSKPLIPVNEIKDELNIKIEHNNEFNVVIVKSLFDDEMIGEISKDRVKVRTEKSIWAQSSDILQEGDIINILDQEQRWVKVLTNKGMVGYILSNDIPNRKEVLGIEREAREPIWKPDNGKIFLTWEHVFSRNPDTSKIGKLEGVNVVSPTWIHLTHSSGKIKDNISKDYIEWAKDRGYKVWVLFSNSFNPDMTHEFLSDALARERTIRDLIKLVKDNNMDGINIDFENVYLKDKEKLVQFIRELTPIFHENNLVVSIDVTIKSKSENWSMFYDREALGEIVDYIAVMTYDEHWAASPISGSVASIGWVERGMKGILEEVPAEKLLLGLPFYTRVWIETPSTKEVNKMDVDSKAITMETVNNILRDEDIIKLWDEEAGQYYAVYMKDNKLHKIWIEDEESLKIKTELVNKYNLAGVAAWRRGFETNNIWEVIDKTINKR